MKKRITPWGVSDHCETISDGIDFYSTPSHGGFYVSKQQRHKMLLQFVNNDGWYEEDCEASKVILGFPHLFSKENVERAKKSFEFWFNPDGTYKREFN